MNGRRVKPQTTERLAKLLAQPLIIAIRAVIVMFVAAVIAKRFEVFAAIGYVESLAWAAGYGLVRGLFHKDEEES